MTSEAVGQRQLRAVLRFVGERTGLAFHEDRLAGAAAAVACVARRNALGDGRILERLTGDKRLFEELVAELTVGETYFFREPAQFAFVREHVLPELSRRGWDDAARIWSAGCASGEEAYSLAILCDEEGLAERAQIVGTDISRAALAKARRGVYREWSLRGVPAEAVQRYLRRDGDNYLLDERIKRRVEFRPLNLAEGLHPARAGEVGRDAETPPPWHAGGPYDLIFCRNVLIYFDAATVAAVAGRLFDALAPGGWLLTASSDPPVGDLAAWETVVSASAIAFRRPAIGRKGSAPFIAADEARQTAPPTVGPRPNDEGTPARDSSYTAPESWQGTPTADGPARGFPEAESWPDPAAAAARVREWSNRDAAEALRFCEESTLRHPLSAELHYLQAVLLAERDRLPEAAAAVRRAIYLDRSLAMAHFTLGTILERSGDAVGACRAYRNAREAAMACPAGRPLALSDGERVDDLASAAERRLEALRPPRPRVER